MNKTIKKEIKKKIERPTKLAAATPPTKSAAATSPTRLSAPSELVRPVAPSEPGKPKEKDNRYFEAVGRRKTAIARVRFLKGNGSHVIINGRPMENYFSLERLKKAAIAPIESLKLQDKFNINVKIKGGGFKAQAEAIKHGIARVLIEINPIFKKRLRKLGFLTRDSRVVERKKYGLKKARRAPQWQKR